MTEQEELHAVMRQVINSLKDIDRRQRFDDMMFRTINLIAMGVFLVTSLYLAYKAMLP